MIADRNEAPSATENHQPLVLVVDDEPAIREEIAEYLQARGFQVESASNGRDALGRLKTNPSVTVMLSDIRMPEMDGLTLAKKAIAQGGEQDAIEVVMLTGHATVGDAAAATRLRAIDFLEKPLELTALRAALLRAHESAAARRARWREMRALDTAQAETRIEIGTLQSMIEQLRGRLARLNEATAAGDSGRNAFMSVMNHELRTPLVPIIGLAELIEVSPETLDPSQLKNFAREIRLGGQRLERVLSRITEFTHLISGQAQLHRAPCRPDRIVQAVQTNAMAALTERRQTLATDIGTQRALNTSSGNIQRLLGELIDNASRFSPEGSTIALSVLDEGDGVAFRVADAGPGMTQAETEVATTAFRQIDMSLSRPVEGLGIGLPMALRIAERLGGSLSIDSEPGRGTTVILHLPADAVLAPLP